jgi:16S rRNA (cytosine967-C5)-methyltransferase
VLQDKLVHLWQKLAAETQPPALDRFLARELGRLHGLSRTDRLWLGDLLTDAVRFGTLTLFCETWRREGRVAGTTAAGRLANVATPEGPETWRRLGRLPVPIVFFWTFMRKRQTGAELPAIAPPGPFAAEVWKTVRDEMSGSLEPALRAMWAGLPPAVVPELAARAEASDWTPTDMMAFCDNHALRPPVGLRVYWPQRLAELRAELAAAGLTVEGHSPSLAVRGERGVYELESYQRGVCDIQDRASQAIGDMVAALPGELIWDCCAGAGGKSLQLAAAMGGKGLVLATDLYANKLQDLQKRAARAGLVNIRTAIWDGLAVPTPEPAVAGRGGYDAVLVDAPCSGSGTWRRNVDGRLRFVSGPLATLTDTQKHLLALAATAVRPGGRLVYATCSWLTGENEEVVAAFLAANPAWQVKDASLLGSPGLDADTTFACALRRPAGPRTP